MLRNLFESPLSDCGFPSPAPDSPASRGDSASASVLLEEAASAAAADGFVAGAPPIAAPAAAEPGPRSAAAASAALLGDDALAAALLTFSFFGPNPNRNSQKVSSLNLTNEIRLVVAKQIAYLPIISADILADRGAD